MPKGIFKRTKESIEKIRQSNLGQIRSKKTCRKMSKSHSVNIGSIRRTGEYNLIKVEEHKWKPYYRYKLEKYIGYKLPKKWTIHHIDGNKLNDRLSNLYIFKKNGYHMCFETLIKIDLINRFILKSNLKNFKRG